MKNLATGCAVGASSCADSCVRNCFLLMVFPCTLVLWAFTGLLHGCCHKGPCSSIAVCITHIGVLYHRTQFLLAVVSC